MPVPTHAAADLELVQPALALTPPKPFLHLPALYERLPEEAQAGPGVSWEGKAAVTFSDAITAVRRWPWTSWAFAKGGHGDPFTKLPEPLRRTLLYALAPAARAEIRKLRFFNW